MQPAPRFQMNAEDWASFGKATLKYFAPLLIVFLGLLQTHTPLKDALPVLWGGLLQMAINFLTKFLDNPTLKV